MLNLENIVKTYRMGDTAVEALRGVTMRFRESEFVAVLGPSGCGKTTLLNVIGGLDGYDAGNLIIDGRSTRSYRSADWDAYRNHSVGFVFQSYNLIPHQTVLANVELALTLSGVSKSERRRRAKEALERVGLGDQLRKKPNQMSGGQMQRVAIARALVNDPRIILADEPTGALDSETSVQIMELLKEISHDKLIIMVTHNPDLASAYASRTIRLLDGRVVSDSNPFETAPEPPAPAGKKRAKKPSMGFFTALALSFNNLLTKKGRTIMTSFAGSIGIIGIALILSVSQGVQSYIDAVQQDTLSSYPITFQAESVDLTSVLTQVLGAGARELTHEKDQVYSSPGAYEALNALNGAETTTNDLKTFRRYLEDPDSEIRRYLSAVQYSYDLDFNIYTKDADGNIVKSDVMELMQKLFGSAMTGGSGAGMAGAYQQRVEVWEEMLAGEGDELVNPLVKEQYELLYGHWPEADNELMLVLDENNEVSDICLYALGLVSEEEMTKVVEAYTNGEVIDTTLHSWSYKDICDRTFRLVLAADYYQYDSSTRVATDIAGSETGLRYLYDNGMELKIAGILRPDEEAASSMLNGAIAYTSALTRRAAEAANAKPIVAAQLEEPGVDVFNGLPFATGNEEEPSNAEKAAAVKEYFEQMSTEEKAAQYRAIAAAPSDEYVSGAVEQALGGLDRAAMEQKVREAALQNSSMDEQSVAEYIASMDDETLLGFMREALEKQIAAQYAEQAAERLDRLSAEQLAAAFTAALPRYTEAELAVLYDRYMPPTRSESTLEENLKKLGYVDLEDPSAIQLFAATFQNKNNISDAIDAYNEGREEEQQITYTDYVALLMSSITTVINAISYVLIAFVAISLIVSSIMIGIITYISVLERTKEIGILRAIGASRRDVGRVFNAETLIVGFTAGLIGILATLAFNLLINVILHAVTHIPTLNAVLPWGAAVVLVLISMLLTYVAGLIPSFAASKKDPVIALRTE